MTMQVQQLPEFNPVRAGFPLTPQGYGPNEQMPLGQYDDGMYGLGQYDMYGLGQNGETYGEKVKAWIAENPYMAVGAGVVTGYALYYAYMMYMQQQAY